ncbi:MAG TPA: sulfotransferase family 2 domain-containing protein [Rhizomicrobium sp.]|jgi:hypothetical protein
MIVSSRHRFVFAHVPKTGGISIRAALEPFADKANGIGVHDTLNTLLAARPETRAYFKFAFVRNPWDRLVSFYFYARRFLARPVPQLQSLSFEGMLRALDGGEAWTAGIFAMRPQTAMVAGADFTGRFERLAQDFATACTRIGIAPTLPRKNASDHLAYATYYNDWSRSFVTRHYAGDVDTFGYRFEAVS